MILRILILFIGILISLAEVSGQERGKVAGEIVLPTEVNGWKWDGKKTKYNPRTLFDYIDGAAELYLAYGFQSLAVRRLEKSNQPSIILELYEMETAEDAFGVFSFERQDEEVGVGQGSEYGGGLLRFWKGKYFVAIYAEGEGAEIDKTIINCAQLVARAIPESAPLPKIIKYLPPGYIEKSLRYLKNHVLLNQRFFLAQKNILNLNRQTEAVLVQYLRYKQKMHVLFIRYPSLPEAQAAAESFRQAYLPEAQGKDRLQIEDKKWTFLKHWQEYILIVLDAPDEAGGEEICRNFEKNLKR
ncbi:MAG: DUF6599 family protein [Thermodesulfobacteriota bacterium]